MISHKLSRHQILFLSCSDFAFYLFSGSMYITSGLSALLISLFHSEKTNIFVDEAVLEIDIAVEKESLRKTSVLEENDTLRMYLGNKASLEEEREAL